MARSRKYEDFLLEHLRNHDEAVAYLNARLESVKMKAIIFARVSSKEQEEGQSIPS